MSLHQPHVVHLALQGLILAHVDEWVLAAQLLHLGLTEQLQKLFKAYESSSRSIIYAHECRVPYLHFVVLLDLHVEFFAAELVHTLTLSREHVTNLLVILLAIQTFCQGSICLILVVGHVDLTSIC